MLQAKKLSNYIKSRCMDFGRHPAMEAVSSPIKCQHRDNKYCDVQN